MLDRIAASYVAHLGKKTDDPLHVTRVRKAEEGRSRAPGCSGQDEGAARGKVRALVFLYTRGQRAQRDRNQEAERMKVTAWMIAAYTEIYDALRSQGVEAATPSGALWPTELFTDEEGDATVFNTPDATLWCTEIAWPIFRAAKHCTPGVSLARSARRSAGA